MPTKRTRVAPMQVDMTNVKDGGGRFNKRHQPPNDYPGKIKEVELVSKKGDKSTKMWLWTIEVTGPNGVGTYPYYTGFAENVLWKIRNLFAAAGVAVPKKRVSLDPNKILGRSIGVSLDDEEYEGKLQSVIQSTFPTSELPEGEPEDDEDEEDEDTDDEETDEDEDSEDEDDSEDSDEGDDAEDEDDEDDDEEDEEEPPPPPKKTKKKASKATKSSKAKRKTAEVDDDELEELDIEDV